MPLFNRIVAMVILALIVVAAWVAFATPNEWLSRLANLSLMEVTPLGRGLLGLAATVLTVICGALLYLEVREGRPDAVVLMEVAGGTAELATDSVAQKLEHDILSLTEVRAVEAIVSRGGKAVNIRLTVHTEPESDVPSKAAEVSQLVREDVEEMGLKLGKLRLRMRYMPYSAVLVEDSTRRVATPGASEEDARRAAR